MVLSGRTTMRFLAVLTIPCALFAQPARDYPVKPVPFTSVHFNDVFWAPRIEINRAVTIPFAFGKNEETGRVGNFERAATVLRGEPLADKKAPRLSASTIPTCLQGHRRRQLRPQRAPRPSARRVRGRPDRAHRRGAGEGRLSVHHAHHRPGASASVGGNQALGTGEGGQPRALRPRPSLRGRRRALPGHRQAQPARYRAEERHAAGEHLRPRQGLDLARPPDHRNGTRQALPRHRGPGLRQSRQVHARRPRS